MKLSDKSPCRFQTHFLPILFQSLLLTRSCCCQGNGLPRHSPQRSIPFCVYKKVRVETTVCFQRDQIPADVHSKAGPRSSCLAGVQQDGRALSWRPGAGVALPHWPTARPCTAWAAPLNSWDQTTNVEVHTMWTRPLAVKPLDFKFLVFWTALDYSV